MTLVTAATLGSVITCSTWLKCAPGNSVAMSVGCAASLDTVDDFSSRTTDAMRGFGTAGDGAQTPGEAGFGEAGFDACMLGSG